MRTKKILMMSTDERRFQQIICIMKEVVFLDAGIKSIMVLSVELVGYFKNRVELINIVKCQMHRKNVFLYN